MRRTMRRTRSKSRAGMLARRMVSRSSPRRRSEAGVRVEGDVALDEVARVVEEPHAGVLEPVRALGGGGVVRRGGRAAPG